MATQYDPIAKDESLNTTEATPRNIADVLAEELSGIASALTPAQLASLADVTISSPSDGQTLKYDAATQKWVNANDAGGHTIENPSGTDMTQRGNLQFTGDGVSVTDDAVDGKTIVDISPDAEDIPYDNTSSGLSATDAQGAIDAVAAMFGTGSGRANCMAYREEITAITQEMWDSIADGTFSKVHVGMHYTAPSGQAYWFADADYFFGSGDTEQTNHHFLVIEDKINGRQQQQASNVTTGGATSSLIYTTYLPAHQSELEADFGAAHILEARLLLSNAVSNGSPSGWAWAGKKSFLMNMPMVFGHYLQPNGNTGEMFNGGNRVRQLALFQAMPETIIARNAETDERDWWWTDDVANAYGFGLVDYGGHANINSASNANGVRRAFIIG